MNRILLYVVLFIIQMVIAILASIGSLTLLCLYDNEFMYLMWDYPVVSISVGTSVWSAVLLLFVWEIKRLSRGK